MSTPDDQPVRASAFGCITIPFLLIALVPLLWGARGNWQDGQLLRSGTIVDGRVVELRHVPTNPSIRMQKTSVYSPVVTFTTEAGETRTAIGSTNRGPAPWAVGDHVDIVYDPANPERADLVSEVENWVYWMTCWSLVGLVPLAIALAPVALLIRQRSRRAG